jgi:hypothetical protein
MKVWVITTGSYSDDEIVTVFTDKVKADLFCAAHNDQARYDHYYCAEEYDTDTEDIQVAEGTKPHYDATVHVNKRTGIVNGVYVTSTLKPLSGFVKDYDGIAGVDYSAILATDDEEVIKKIFYDWMAQKKAEEADL